MTEYWKSIPKFWCRYCKLYVTDNKVCRQRHEKTGKHKRNVQYYLDGIRKKELEASRDKNLLLKELGKIEKAANSSCRNDYNVFGLKDSPCILEFSNVRNHFLNAKDNKLEYHKEIQSNEYENENEREESEVKDNAPNTDAANESKIGEWKVVSRRVISPEEEQVRMGILDDNADCNVKKNEVIDWDHRLKKQSGHYEDSDSVSKGISVSYPIAMLKNSADVNFRKRKITRNHQRNIRKKK